MFDYTEPDVYLIICAYNPNDEEYRIKTLNLEL